MKASAKERNRHILTAEVPLDDIAALRAMAATEDRTVSQLVRVGVRYVLSEWNEAAPRQKGRPRKTDAQAGAIHDPH